MLANNRSILLIKSIWGFNAYIIKIYTYLNYNKHISILVSRSLYTNNGAVKT